MPMMRWLLMPMLFALVLMVFLWLSG